ncbi:Tyrosine recombinase XerA [Metallosphaera sp. J1]|uniref:site-specific tyrosine recombinase/integron integrase n=1 Tax=Metallosphaera TaxID=41980 RepID=UPI001EDEBFA5|nr:site-specific tyrosine recombinase/integron integrase [Metallosphaera javensis (ex Hofmann et al. 2022)]MCG3109542.1 Tyrosine recombinase XerA [Metallosphaera javensis (ex Hofmann et al. 2022)]BCS94122.1 MAG: tyrosine recombinase XerA [Metallosphaera javensis (ex Sakai et al. 2022)]
MKLQLGEPPADADPFQYFMESLRFSGAGQGTIKLYSTAIQDFLQFVKKDPRTVTTQDVINWISSLNSRKGRSRTTDRRGRSATIRSYVIAVRRFLKWLGVNVRPPVPRIRGPERVALREEDITALLSACKRLRDKVIISLLVDTGLRSSELLSLKRGDVDLDRMVIRVRETKNGEERIVFFTSRTATLLKQYLRKTRVESDQNDPLFNMTYQALYKLIKRLGKRVGLTWLRPHILRHTFATNAIRRGIPLPAVQRLMGHKDIKTTQIYTHLITEDLENAYRKAFET